jgi:hypothetical protein
VAIIHKTIFARFGYKLDMKVGGKKKTESFYIHGYLLELITEKYGDLGKKKSFKIWRVWAIFFLHGKSFVKVEIIFFRSKIFGEISLKKNCDNHFGYKQKSLKKTLACMQTPFVTNPWQVVREVRCAQSDKGVLCRKKHLSEVLVVPHTSCATCNTQPYLTMNI